jgi:prevent-host-death family protein
MKATGVVHVGVRELKNHLAKYLRLARRKREVIITHRGKPIAVIRPLTGGIATDSRDAGIAALSAKGKVTAPSRALTAKVRRVKISGRPRSVDVLNDRR